MSVIFRKPHASVGVLLLVILGAFLRIAQYGSGRSIWLDEASLLLNVLERDYAALLLPLGHHQVAPVLFLVLLKAAADVLGSSDAAFRLVPLLLSLVALPWIYPLARRWSGSTQVGLFTLFFYATSLFLIRYSTEVKQYTVDMSVCIGLCAWLTAPRQMYTTKEQCWLALAGLIGIGLSNIAILVLATLALFHFLAALRNPGRWPFVRTLVFPGIVWGIGFGLYYTFFMHQHPSRAYMVEYWQFAFMPSNLFSSEWGVWTGQHFGYFLFKILFYDFNGLGWLRAWLLAYLVLWGLGIGAGWRARHHTMLFFTFVPTGIHLALSAWQLYPFDPRIALYLALPHFICVAYGLHTALKWVQRSTVPVGYSATFALLLLIWPVQLLRNFPVKFDEIRPSLAFVQQHQRESSRVYLPGYTRNVFNYYSATAQAPFAGVAYFDDPDAAAQMPRALDSLQGPVWVVTAHIPDAEETKMIECLKRRGELRRAFQAKGSAAYLFDLLPAADTVGMPSCACTSL